MQEQPKIKTLIGIRFICMLCIYLHHATPFAYGSFGFYFLRQFYSFVSFFFVLSGFVIYYKYSSLEKYNTKEFRNYLITRFARIFPLLFIILSISYFGGFYKGTESHSGKVYLYNIFFMKAFSEKYFMTMIGPSWSLSADVLFYLSVPAVFLAWRKYGKPTLIVGVIYLLGIIIYLINKSLGTVWFSDFHFVGMYTFWGRALDFVLGIYLAKIVKQEYTVNIQPKLAGALGAFIVLMVLLALSQFGKGMLMEHGIRNYYGLALHNFVMPFGIFLFLYWIIYDTNLFTKFLSWKPIQELGNATYSIYILHTSILLGIIHKYVSTNYVITIVFIFVASVACYKLVEQPLYKFIKKIAKA